MVIPSCEQRLHITLGFILVKVLEFDYNIYAHWNMITLIWKLAFHIQSINHLSIPQYLNVSNIFYISILTMKCNIFQSSKDGHEGFQFKANEPRNQR
jgi:hypothetical protein